MVGAGSGIEMNRGLSDKWFYVLAALAGIGIGRVDVAPAHGAAGGDGFDAGGYSAASLAVAMGGRGWYIHPAGGASGVRAWDGETDAGRSLRIVSDVSAGDGGSVCGRVPPAGDGEPDAGKVVSGSGARSARLNQHGYGPAQAVFCHRPLSNWARAPSTWREHRPRAAVATPLRGRKW